MNWMPYRSVVVALALGALSTGCAQESQPSSFYLLSYPSGGTDAAPATTMREGVQLGVGPIELPQYLDRPQIVTRSSGNRLELEEFDRWGGRLNENFTIVLAEVLSSDLTTDGILIYPWTVPSRVEFQVIVHVTAFETDGNGQSVLDARWSIVDPRRQDVLVMARSSLREAVQSSKDPLVAGTDYDAIAAAMSRNVAALGRDIAAQIRTLAAR